MPKKNQMTQRINHGQDKVVIILFKSEFLQILENLWASISKEVKKFIH